MPLIVLAYVGFVSLGLPDAVIGVAWPSLRDYFELPQIALGLIFVCSGCGYFLSSFFSGKAVQTLGIGLLLAASTVLVASSALGFAFSPIWWALLSFAVLHGLGSGAIDAGLNGYAASNMSAGHMNWLHACYCLGAMLGPLVMTWALTTSGTYWMGYAAIGGVMLALAIVFTFTGTHWGSAAREEAHAGAGIWETLRHGGPITRALLMKVLVASGRLHISGLSGSSGITNLFVLQHLLDHGAAIPRWRAPSFSPIWI